MLITYCVEFVRNCNVLLLISKLDTRPSLSPKPSPRAMSTSHVRSNLVNMQDTEHRKNGISSDVPKMNSNGHVHENNDLNDEVDDGLAALKRQPSIKDRRRVCIASIFSCLKIYLNIK